MKAPRLATIASLLFSILLPAPVAHALTTAHLSSQRYGGAGNESGLAVAVDASGNVYIAGSFENTMDLGGGNLVSAGGADVFLAKFLPNGAFVWNRSFGSNGTDVAYGLAVTPAGDIYITGSFTNSVDFGGGALASAGTADGFLARYSTNSAHVFSLRFGGTSFDEGLSVAVDGSGSAYVTGDYYGIADFGGGNLAFSGVSDAFLVKYSNVGAHQWSQRFGGTSADVGRGVAIDGLGYLLLTGSFWNTVNFGGGNLVSGGAADIFVAKYHPMAGIHQWSARYGSTEIDEGWAIAGSTTGNAIVTGYFGGTVNLGGSNLTTAGGNDIFLASYNLMGAHQWSLRFGNTLLDIGRDIAVDALGNAYATGSAVNSVNFGGGTLPGGGGSDGYLAKFDAAGVHQWSRLMGSTSNDVGYSLALDNTGRVINSGSFNGTVNFGGGNLVSAGGVDIYLAKYSAASAEPIISSIVDIGNDQGRKVKIRFSRSGADDAITNLPVQRYAAFRRDAAPPAASSAFAIGSQALESGWTQVGSVDAFTNSDYGIDVPTVGDSTIALGQYRSTFLIRAATTLPATYYDSPPDSGYSLDNLAPGVPQNLVFQTGDLSWNESSAADFDYFTVYGSNTDSFGAATLVDYTVTPAMDVSASPYVYYFVAATDFSGNEGNPAKVNTLSGAGGTPSRYVLSVSNYPNPFNPRTTVSYTVPSRGRVSVAVYDARGERVATLFDGERSPGAFSVDWDGRTDAAGAASGVYFARIEHASGTRSKKMVLLK